MSDIIELLARQSNVELDANVENFARSIVRECLEVMRLVPYITDREFGEEYVYQEAIENHFGVKE